MHKERGRLQRKWSDPGSTRGVEDAAMALLVDAAAFDLRAGFTELAVARIQAALEFNLFRPASVTGGVPAVMPLAFKLKRCRHKTCMRLYDLRCVHTTSGDIML